MAVVQWWEGEDHVVVFADDLLGIEIDLRTRAGPK